MPHFRKLNTTTNAHRQNGVAAVELAIVLPLMLLIFAGIVEFGRAFWHYDALSKAARDGARVMSIYPKATIQSAGISAAKSIVVNAANSAGIKPSLTAGQVVITCLDSTFGTVACTDGVSPENIKVEISGYSINIGESIPFFVSAGETTSFTNIPLAPHTIMRYML